MPGSGRGELAMDARSMLSCMSKGPTSCNGLLATVDTVTKIGRPACAGEVDTAKKNAMRAKGAIVFVLGWR